MNESLRRVDAHQHFWRYVLGEFDWMGANMAELRRDFLPPELRLLLDREKIGGTVAVQSRASEADTDFLLELAAAHPWILGVVGWIDLRAADLEAAL
ncbi:amidohydrolase, partial [uncultured Bilophila sp.]